MQTRMALSITSPVIVADVLGATVFLVSALYFLFAGASSDVQKAQVFTALFAALAVAIAIVIK